MATNYTTGINLSDTSVEWTTLRATQDGLELLQTESEALSENGEFPLALQQGRHHGVVAGGLPASLMLTHVCNLPSTDLDEIAGMVELQLDKISPYPLQQLVISFEILAQGETQTRVLIAGVKREIVEKLGAKLEGAGLRLSSLDLQLLCRWHQLLNANRVDEEGNHAILLIEKGEVGLIIAQDGEPVLFRSLPESDSADELWTELDYSLTTLEQEFHLNGLDCITIWSDGSLPELVEAISKNALIALNTCELSELAPLSEALAYRYHTRSSQHLELVPNEWLESAKNKALIRKLYKFGGILLGSWLSLLLLFSIAFSIQKHQANKLRNTANELAGPANAVLETSSKVNTLLNYTDQSHSAIEALREISTLLPAGVDLSAFNYKKGRALTLRGEAEAGDDVYKFFTILSQSEFFKEIKDQRVTIANRKGQRISQFSLTAVPEGVE